MHTYTKAPSACTTCIWETIAIAISAARTGCTRCARASDAHLPEHMSEGTHQGHDKYVEEKLHLGCVAVDCTTAETEQRLLHAIAIPGSCRRLGGIGACNFRASMPVRTGGSLSSC